MVQMITALYTGGAEHMQAELSHAWAAEYEVHVIYFKPIHTLRPKFAPGTQFHCVGLNLGSVFRVRRLLKALKPAVIHTHLGQADLLGMLAAWHLPGRKVLTLHNVFFSQDWKDRFYFAAYRFILNYIVPEAQVVSISRATDAHALTTLGLPRARVHFIYNYQRAPAGRDLSLPASLAHITVPILLFAGRLEPQKNLPVLLEALTLLVAKGIDFHLAICGEGTLKTELQAQSSALGLNQHITWEGYVPSLAPYLAAARCMVLPSRFEGLPLVVLEAFAEGCPVVATQIPGPDEIITHGHDGYLLPEALATTLITLLTHPGLATQMGQAARARAQTWPNQAQHMAAMRAVYVG